MYPSIIIYRKNLNIVAKSFDYSNRCIYIYVRIFNVIIIFYLIKSNISIHRFLKIVSFFLLLLYSILQK